MEMVISLRGQDLLRVKGIVNVEGQPRVVQGVGHVFHPPVALDRWPSEDAGTRLVFITRNMDASAIEGLFNAVVGMQALAR
jgi:G3E family GTPase